MVKPVYLPPVWCPENSDGTYSWPGRIGWTVIHSLKDIPPLYRNPPTKWVKNV